MEQLGLIFLVFAIGALFSLKLMGYRAKLKKDVKALRFYFQVIGPVILIGCMLLALPAFESGKWYWILLWLVAFGSGLTYSFNPDYGVSIWVNEASPSVAADEIDESDNQD